MAGPGTSAACSCCLTGWAVRHRVSSRILCPLSRSLARTGSVPSQGGRSGIAGHLGVRSLPQLPVQDRDLNTPQGGRAARHRARPGLSSACCLTGWSVRHRGSSRSLLRAPALRSLAGSRCLTGRPGRRRWFSLSSWRAPLPGLLGTGPATSRGTQEGTASSNRSAGGWTSLSREALTHPLCLQTPVPASTHSTEGTGWRCSSGSSVCGTAARTVPSHNCIKYASERAASGALCQHMCTASSGLPRAHLLHSPNVALLNVPKSDF